MTNAENDCQSADAADQSADTVRNGSAIRTEETLRRNIARITDATGEAPAFKSRSRTMGAAWRDLALSLIHI